MTTTYIANLIPDARARTAWVAAGMPTDLAEVARIVIAARRSTVARLQVSCPICDPRTRRIMSRPHVAA